MFKNAIIRYGEQPASEFLAHPHNPRKHPDKQRKLVNASLKRFGWVAPVVVNVTTGYVAGANQTAIAKQLGIRKVINQTGASYGIQD